MFVWWGKLRAFGAKTIFLTVRIPGSNWDRIFDNERQEECRKRPIKKGVWLGGLKGCNCSLVRRVIQLSEMFYFLCVRMKRKKPESPGRHTLSEWHPPTQSRRLNVDNKCKMNRRLSIQHVQTRGQRVYCLSEINDVKPKLGKKL